MLQLEALMRSVVHDATRNLCWGPFSMVWPWRQTWSMCTLEAMVLWSVLPPAVLDKKASAAVVLKASATSSSTPKTV